MESVLRCSLSKGVEESLDSHQTLLEGPLDLDDFRGLGHLSANVNSSRFQR